MGAALRYNAPDTMTSVRQLMRAASSRTHARIVMALTGFLPLLNRNSFQAAGRDQVEARCLRCLTGLRQDSSHLFNCPFLARPLMSWLNDLTSLMLSGNPGTPQEFPPPVSSFPVLTVAEELEI